MAPSSTTTLSREPMKLILLGRFWGVGTLPTLINMYSKFYAASPDSFESHALMSPSCESHHVFSLKP